MSDRAETASPSAPPLHAALLDYARAPGKYQLTLRQPALLFASIREILQLAAGRTGVEGASGAAADELREAAGFFIRAALLYPGADHYAVLGLPPRSEPVELKERYRLLMRLTHPDFASGASAVWSADAAVRVNRAYEVLSSPVQRAEYDEQLAGVRSPSPAEPPGHRPVYAQAAPRREARPWQLNPVAGWMLAAGGLALIVMLLVPGQEPAQLVQKSVPAPPLAGMARTTPPPAETAAVLISADELPLAPAAPPAPVQLAEAPVVVPPSVASPAPPPVQVAPAATPVAPTPTAPRVPVAASTPRPVPLPAAVPAPVARPAVAAPVPMPAALPAPPVQRAAAPAPLGGPSAAELAAAHRRAQAQAASTPVAVARAPEPIPARAQESAPTVGVPVAPPMVTAAPPPRVVPVAIVPAGPTLNDAQPLLTQLLHLLESGSGDQLLRLLEADARHTASAQALSRQYEQMVRGARTVRLSHVEFRSESREGTLLVTGRVRLHAGEPTIGTHGERLLLRAEFQSRGGKVLLTGLSGAAD